jgi:hypothetical protein
MEQRDEYLAKGDFYLARVANEQLQLTQREIPEARQKNGIFDRQIC